MEMPDVIYVEHSADEWVNGKYTPLYEGGAKWDGSKTEYHRSRVVEALRKENEEQARILGMSAEIELSLRAKLDLLEREKEKLKAKLDKANWQPIETAPKTGERILLAAPWIPLDKARLQTCYGHWYKIGNRWEYDGYSFGNPTSQPTKWMPLPDANAPEQP